MVQVINQGGNNNGVSAAIPLYQKGFDWLKFWLGFCFACCLCLIFAAAVTFLTLYIIAQSGGIGQRTNTGRMMGAQISAVVDNKPMLDKINLNQPNKNLININNHQKNAHQLNSNVDYKYKYERLKSIPKFAA